MEQAHQVLVEPVRRDDRTVGLADGSVDAGLVWGRVDDPRYTAVEVLREERVGAISRRSGLALRDSVTWRGLGRRCLVLNTVSGTLTPDDWTTGARPEIGAEAANLDELPARRRRPPRRRRAARLGRGRERGPRRPVPPGHRRPARRPRTCVRAPTPIRTPHTWRPR
ncbi:LysR substrate-binding domain-containing protein [Streptomyces sp. NPDC058676]|uniref:LysR substrate-binding domain-containing protein n=1 Tax=unclassified Streptomyces TaxID=2593676 RepID=UPI00365D5953